MSKCKFCDNTEGLVYSGVDALLLGIPVKQTRKKNLMTLDLPYETANFIVAAVIIISVVAIIAKAVIHVKGKK